MKRISFVSFLVFLRIVIFSQDIHFSQFNMSPLTLNPGLAGVNYNFQAIINYKDQWRSVAVPYKTYAVSVDSRINKKGDENNFWAAGINVFRDKAGDAKMGIFQANLTAAYHINIARYHTLGIGLQGGYAQRSIDFEALKWANQYDPRNGYNPDLPSGEPFAVRSIAYGDIGAGLVWAYNNTSGLIHVEDNHELQANMGVAVYHARQNISFYKTSKEQLYPRFVIHGSALISMPNNHNIALVPGLVFMSQGPSKELNFGSMIRYNVRQESKYTDLKKSASFYVGLYYRLSDALTPIVQLELSRFSVGLSYDINISKLAVASNARGGFEIALRFTTSDHFKKSYDMPKSKERKSKNKIKSKQG